MVDCVTLTEFGSFGPDSGKFEKALNAVPAALDVEGRDDSYIMKFDADRFAIFGTTSARSGQAELPRHFDRSLLEGVERSDRAGTIVASDLREGRMAARAALHASLVAKPGQRANVVRFIQQACAMVAGEPETLAWYGIDFGASEFALVEFFSDDRARDAHMNAEAAKSLMAQAAALFIKPPEIRFGSVI